MHSTRKAQKYIFLAGLIALAFSVVSQNALNQKNVQQELDQLFADAYYSGQIAVEPISDTDNRFWQQNNSFFLANLIQKPEKQPFTGGDEYVIERLDTGDLLKVAIDPNSEFKQQLSNQPVLVEANINFSAHQLSKQQLQLIQEYNLAPKQYFDQFTDVADQNKPTIALIDSGFANWQTYQNRLAVNSQELAGSPNRDDDNNGLIDDTYGWNFLDNNSQVTDYNGHGTHLAGIMLALSNANLLPVQALDAQNSVSLDRLLAAINYAVDRGADVINLSIGSTQDSVILKKLLGKLEGQGVIIVASAGNQNQNVVLKPAAYHSVVAVGATDNNNQRAYYSNYGPEIDFSFKGQLLSFSPNGKFLIIKEGTSQAAAAVSAILAQLKAQMPDLSPQELVAKLQSLNEKIADYPLGYQIDLTKLSQTTTVNNEL